MWISKEKYEELMSRLDCTQKGLDFAREQTAQKQKELDAYKAEVEKQKREPVVMAQAQARDMIHRKLLGAEKTADPVELAKLTELWWKFWKNEPQSLYISTGTIYER